MFRGAVSHPPSRRAVCRRLLSPLFGAGNGGLRPFPPLLVLPPHYTVVPSLPNHPPYNSLIRVLDWEVLETLQVNRASARLPN